MHSCPQFTRSTLSRGIYLSGGNYFQGKFYGEGAIILEGNDPESSDPGSNYQEAIFLGTIVLEPNQTILVKYHVLR